MNSMLESFSWRKFLANGFWIYWMVPSRFFLSPKIREYFIKFKMFLFLALQIKFVHLIFDRKSTWFRLVFGRLVVTSSVFYWYFMCLVHSSPSRKLQIRMAPWRGSVPKRISELLWDSMIWKTAGKFPDAWCFHRVWKCSIRGVC